MEKVVILMLSIIMPPNIPDIQHAVRVDSAEECWTAAKKFAEKELSDDMKAHGALGLGAACMFMPKSEDQMKHEQQEEEKEKM